MMGLRWKLLGTFELFLFNKIMFALNTDVGANNPL